jgi:ATP adenylyltransferase
MAKQKTQDAKNLVFLRSEYSFGVLNKFPYTNGHAMICPNSHKKELKDLEAVEMLDLLKLLTRVQKRLNKILSPQGYNIGINVGSCAGAGIRKHLHMHLVPRWKGDTNFMPILSGTKVVSQSLKELYRQLKK